MSFIVKNTICETFLERVRQSPSRAAICHKVNDQWKSLTFTEFFEECRISSFGLMSLALQPGERVALISNTRWEWSLLDMAILGARGVTVPVYPSNTAEDVAYILDDSEAKIAIVENSIQLHKILEIRQKNPHALSHLKKIVTIESQALAITLDSPELSQDVLTLVALKELGRREQARAPEKFEENLKATTPQDILTICYTSGTTGIPKGVVLQHDAMISVLEDSVKIFGNYLEGREQIILSFLPFSHILGKVESMALYTFGWTQAFAENIDKVVTNMSEIRPTLFFSVPRIFEKAYNKVLQTVQEGPFAQRSLFNWAIRAGRAYHTALWDGKQPSFQVRAEYAIARKVVFSKIQERFGGRLTFSACGGAPLSREVAEFFHIAGIQVLEGYGLTETCAPVTFNTPALLRLGTVGRPMPEVMIKTAEDGEILVKSRKLFQGYWKKPEETRAVLEDGWFKTGDIGFLDAQGYLTITDRKKDLLITSAGKNVAPQKIEALAKTQKLINQFVVLGDRRSYLSALVTLDREQIIRYAQEKQILFSGFEELVRNPRVIARIQKAIDQINEKLPSYETIKKFVIVSDEFTVESGELTPSLKVRRKIIAERYKTQLDNLY